MTDSPVNPAAGPSAPPAPPRGPWQASARLRLREFAAHDVAELARMHRDPRVRALLVDDLALDDEAVAARFIGGMQGFYRQHEGTGIWCAERAVPPDADSVAEARQAFDDGDIGPELLALVEAPSWQFIGWFSLVHLRDAPDELEIGARLTPEAWGGSLALDGGEWLLQRALGELGRARAWGHCDPANRSATHCLRVLGFADAGMAAYNGVQAQRFSLSVAHWRDWSAQSRRERQRAVFRGPSV